jgi:hypothetical protein
MARAMSALCALGTSEITPRGQRILTLGAVCGALQMPAIPPDIAALCAWERFGDLLGHAEFIHSLRVEHAQAEEATA